MALLKSGPLICRASSGIASEGVKTEAWAAFVVEGSPFTVILQKWVL